MSLSTPTGGNSTIWPLFQTVLGVRTISSCIHHPPDVHVFQAIVQVTLVCLSGYVLARRRILDKATQRVGHLQFISCPILSFSLGSHTAIERYQRQLFHSLSPLLQSRLLPLTGSAIITIIHPFGR